MILTNIRAVLLATLLVGLLGCQTTDVTPHAESPSDVASTQVDGASIFAIDPTASYVHVLVYRGGRLARLGHNHIISTRNIEGMVHLHPNMARSVIAFTIPVAEFVIDDPNLRREEGDEFASVPSQRDVEGTRGNMLGEGLLNLASFPEIRVTGRQLEVGSDNATIEIAMQVKDTQAIRRIPLKLDMSEEQITAKGELALTHQELGLKPFSVMLGALQVNDTMTVRFSFTARKSAAQPPAS